MDNFKEILKDNIKLIFVLIAVIAILIIINVRKRVIENTSNHEDYPVDELVFQNKYEANEYKIIEVSEYDHLTMYFNKFKMLERTNAEASYNLLTDTQKKVYNNDIETYKKDIKKRQTIKTISSKIEQYEHDKSDTKKYTIIDSENIKYTIYEYAVGDFKVTIDGKL